MASINTFFTKKILKWIKKRAPTGNPQILHSKQIYIFPSGFGLAFILVLLSLTIGAINYQLNAAFLLAFCMVSLALLSMWESHRNIKGLTISCQSIEDTEQGKPAAISFSIQGDKFIRYGLTFSFPGGEAIRVDCVSKQGCTVVLPLATPKRGRFILPPVTIKSLFPLGIFSVRATLFFNREYYVYPAAKNPGFWPLKQTGNDEKQYLSHQIGEEELYELKSVLNPWAQAGRIAWKISARGQGWYLKTMVSPAGENWLFRIEDLDNQEEELNLQQLSYWLQTAEQEGHAYGLDLQGKRTEISHGRQHLQKCLRELATYEN